MKHKITTILYLLLFAVMLVAAQPRCVLKTFSIKDGLASNLISSVTQDANQLLWVGTWNGLCYFDGYGFSSVTEHLGYEMAVNNHLQYIKPNAENDIWCLTYDKRLYLYDTDKCTLVNISDAIDRIVGRRMRVRNIYSLPNGHTWIACEDLLGRVIRINDRLAPTKNGITVYKMRRLAANASVHKVEQDGEGREWIFTSKGIELFGGELGFTVPYEFMQQVGNTLFFATLHGDMSVLRSVRQGLVALDVPTNVTCIQCMVPIDKNRLAVGTDAGVLVFGANGNLLSFSSLSCEGQASAVVTNIFKDSRNRLWIFTRGKGVTLMSLKDYSCTWHTSKAVRVGAATSSTKPLVFEDANQTIWAVPNGGTFCYYDEKKECLIPYILGRDGVKSDVPNIDKNFLDRQRNLWLFSSHELMRVNLLNRKIESIYLEPNIDVRSIGRTGEGSYLVGLHNGRLARLAGDAVKGYFDNHWRESGGTFSSHGRIYAIFTDRMNRCWIGTKGDGLYLVEKGRVRHFVENRKDDYSLLGNDVYDIYEDGKGRLWIACFDKGLNLVMEDESGTIRFVNTRNDMRGYPRKMFCEKVRRIAGITGKYVVLTTAGGLITFSENFSTPRSIKFNVCSRLNDNEDGLSGNSLMQALVASDGRIYLSSSLGGLAVSEGNPLNSKLRFVPIDNGRHRAGIILSMEEDGQGRLWLARENWLERYDMATGQMVAFGSNDFGYDVSFTEARPFYDKTTGRMYMGTHNGVIVFNPDLLRKDDFVPNVVFTSVQFPNDDKQRHVLFVKELDIPSDKRNLTINFASLDYRDQSETQYAYKLDGVDREWNYIGTRRYVSFNNLPDGHLRLLVKSTNADGVWTENTAVLNIYSHPTFWETVWAKILYVLLVLGVIGVAVYVILLRKKAQMDEEMNILRTNFYTEASHRLRTPLTLIGGPVQEVLGENNIDDRERGLLEMVLRNTHRMLELVNKMLEHGNTRNYLVDDDTAPVFLDAKNESLDELNKADQANDGHLSLLVVEDNPDLRKFLMAILGKCYSVTAASNGKEGLEAAVQTVPDFIITDVNMPVMDGLEMVRHIKENRDTCHIPIIVLSAKASLDDKLKGLSEGVDDYITKPFSATYLHHRIENIVAQRKMLQDSLLENLRLDEEVGDEQRCYSVAEVGGEDTTVDSYKGVLENAQLEEEDRKMMEKLLAYLEENMANADLKIADLSSEVCMSRTVFYGKMKSIVGMSPIDFVRYLRLQRAERLVVTTQLPLSTIAYQVGFSDPNYFGKCFKKAMGMSPTEYRAAKGHGI